MDVHQKITLELLRAINADQAIHSVERRDYHEYQTLF